MLVRIINKNKAVSMKRKFKDSFNWNKNFFKIKLQQKGMTKQ